MAGPGGCVRGLTMRSFHDFAGDGRSNIEGSRSVVRGRGVGSLRQVRRPVVKPERVGVRFFMDFFPLMLLAGKRIRIQLSYHEGQNSRKSIGRGWERNCGNRGKGNLVTKNARSGMKEVMSGIKIELAFLLSAFLLLEQLPPSLIVLGI